jgi:membrane-bound lytic murein transglycosylase B
VSDVRPARVTVLLLAGCLAALLVTARLAGGPGPASTRTTRVTITPVDVQAPMRVVPPARSARRQPDPDPAWVTATARQTGIPEVAMAAYGRATLRAGEESPSCRLGWTTLAGIGYVESQHGTLDGRTLDADGHPSLPVVGPALDGRRFAAVRSTAASVAWHGDPRWDHAVGPLQFIPSTWARWATDGDGDGVRDPNDLDDAALATARYLCASGADLTTARGWTAAVRSYNHSDDYVRQVLGAADDYESRTS